MLRWSSFIRPCALLALAGCAGTATPQAPPPASPLLVPRAGWLAPEAKHCRSRLYVSSYRLNYVDVYCTKGHNQAPIGQITDGIKTPEGAAVDRKGNLYITNTNTNSVTEYPRDGLHPSFTYSSGLSAPAGVAVDARQNVYVTSLQPASLEIFPQGVNTASLKIANLPYPIDVAVDAAGNVFVTTYTANFSNGEIFEYGPGSTQGTNLGIVTKVPGGIVLDKAHNIVTADQTLPGVLVFPPGQTQPSQTFAQNALDPDPVRFLKSEKRVYVGDSVGNAVYVYAYPSGKQLDTITDGIDGPNGLALDPPAPLARSPKE